MRLAQRHGPDEETDNEREPDNGRVEDPQTTEDVSKRFKHGAFLFRSQTRDERLGRAGERVGEFLRSFGAYFPGERSSLFS